MNLNPFAISSFLVGLTSVLLALLVRSKSSKDRIYLVYPLQCWAIAIWGFSAFLIGITENRSLTIILWKIAFSSVILIAPFFLHHAIVITKNRHQVILLISYIQSIFFVILTFSNKIFPRYNIIFNSFYYPQGNWLYFICCLIWLSFVFYGNYLLISFYKSIAVNDDDKKSILFLIFASVFGFSFGIVNFLPGFGLKIYPFGNFGLPLFSFFMFYAIFRHNFLAIDLVIRKGLLYFILVSVITIIYLVLFIFMENFSQKSFIQYSFLNSLFFSIVIAVLFIPLKNLIQTIIDRIFLGKSPQQVFRENELLKQELLRSEKLKTVAQFASGMAHEIKNPLTVLKTFAEFLPQKQNDPEFLKKFSSILNSEVGRIDNLVHQLLDFSKPSPLQFKEINIHKLIDETLELLNSQFIKYNITVERNYALPDTRSTLKLDPNQMKQVFLNLFLNAIEAMPKGGTLTVSTQLRAGDIRDNSCQNEFVEICVEDTGCGIPEKDLPHIFEPFYTTKEKGSGLGLSIVYNIVKEHKGKIKLESGRGQGAKFVIQLPLA